MDAEKYSRSVTLLCPTCGSDQFEFEGSDQAVDSAHCTICGREFTKDALLEGNTERINEHVKEIGKEITRDFARNMRRALKGALRDSRYTNSK